MNLLVSKIKGSVLAFTVYILVSITILMGIIFMHYSYLVYNSSKLITKNVMYNDLESAMAFLLYDLGDDYNLNEFINNQSTTIQTIKYTWGLLEVIGARLSNGKDQVSKIAFVGYGISDSSILYIPESNTSLTICGECNLLGDVWISAKGAKRGYLNNFPFVGSAKLINGHVSISDREFPYALRAGISKIESYNNYLNDYPIIRLNYADLEDLNSSFFNEVVLIEGNSPLNLSNEHLCGQIIIKSSQSISIGKDAKLEDIIIQAPYIRIKSGFTGSIQCIATDSIIVEKSCNLNYPSVLALINTERSNSVKTICIDENSTVKGMIYAKTCKVDNSLIEIAKNSLIEGQIYTNGIIDSRIHLTGSVIVGKFIVQITSGFYENYLLNTQIVSNTNKKFLNMLPGIKEQGTRGILKWIN